MEKKVWLHILEWAIAVAALVYLVWRLVRYPDYGLVADSLRSMGWPQWLAMGLCVLLMPVNMLIEAWRWKTLMNEGISELGNERNDGMMSWREAHRQVYYSKLAGLITPWRLGEYPSRALLMARERLEARGERREEDEPTPNPSLKGRTSNIWPRVLSMGAVGSATMTAAIIACGAIAMIANWRLEIGDWRFSYFITIAVVFLLLVPALYFAPRLLKRWAVVSRRTIAVSLAQSFVRLLCWCVQLAFVLFALKGLEMSDLAVASVWLQMPIYYLLVTITPNVPIVEVGVRGAWAMLLFGTPNAALAGVLLWVINTLLPCISWFFLRKTPQISARP
jgi:hypothetical protein